MRMRAGLSSRKQTEETKNIITSIQVISFLDMEHVDLNDHIKENRF